MDSTRQNKVSKLLQKVIGEIFQREGRSLFGNVFITVSGVKVSPDLSVAKVYLSFFKASDPEGLLHTIKDHTKEIRKHLGLKTKNQLRIIPNLEFFHDNSLDYVDKIESLFKNIVIPPADDKDNDK